MCKENSLDGPFDSQLSSIWRYKKQGRKKFNLCLWMTRQGNSGRGLQEAFCYTLSFFLDEKKNVMTTVNYRELISKKVARGCCGSVRGHCLETFVLNFYSLNFKLQRSPWKKRVALQVPIMLFVPFAKWISHWFHVVQLNEYETATYFLQLSQNMTSDFLFTFVIFPVLTWIYLFWKIVLNIKTKQCLAQNR